MAFSALLVAPLWLACSGDEPVGDTEVSKTEVDPGSNPTRAAGRRGPVGAGTPVLRALRFEPARPVAGDPIAVRVEATDPDGDFVHLKYAWTVAGQALRGDTAEMTFPKARKGDTVEVIVTATDGTNETTLRGTTRFRNRPPTLSSVRLEPTGRVVSGTSIVARPTAGDRDEDPIHYEYDWQVNGKSVGQTGDKLNTDHLKRGDKIQVTVVAHDRQDRSPAVESREIEISNAPPKIVSEPVIDTSDGVFRYAIRVEDPDGDRSFRYRLDRAPEGMEIDLASGEISWRPAEDQQGTFPIEIVVDDRKGGLARQSFELTSNVEVVEPAPPASAQ